VKYNSAHFVLTGDSSYKDLAPVFPDILNMLLGEIGQVPEEEEILQMYIEQNMSDLLNDKKPEGYNRKGKVRLIFPMDKKEFYLKSYTKTVDLIALADAVSDILNEAGISFETLENDRTSFS
jgi:hypothetical protein